MNEIDRKMAELEKLDKNFDEWEENGFKKCSILKDVNTIYSDRTEAIGLSDFIKEYQIFRAKEYLNQHEPQNSSEPSLSYCIISDLLKMLSV
jgi:hypothetical protein